MPWYCQTRYRFFTAASTVFFDTMFSSSPDRLSAQHKGPPHVVAGADKGHPHLDPAYSRCKDAACMEDPLDYGELVLHRSHHLCEELVQCHVLFFERVPKEVHKRQPVVAVVLHLLVRDAVSRLEYEHLCHQDDVDVRPSLARVGKKRFEYRPERLPVDKVCNPAKPVVLFEAPLVFCSQ